MYVCYVRIVVAPSTTEAEVTETGMQVIISFTWSPRPSSIGDQKHNETGRASESPIARSTGGGLVVCGLCIVLQYEPELMCCHI